tara:strand:- start:618 stop:986 length:369 start_codon:yes stop_codon:yes gene_type:complete
MGKTKELYAQTFQQDFSDYYNIIKYNMINYELMDEVMSTITSKCRVNDNEFLTQTKESHITEARYLFYAACTKNGIGPSDISRYMKNKGLDVAHSTVIYGINKIQKAAKKDKMIAELLNQYK